MGRTSDRLDKQYLAEEQVEDVVQLPSIYKVILINDDYTPIEFIIDVLQKFFSYDVEGATQLILRVHYQGKAVCGIIYTAEIAETKAVHVNPYARENEHQLLCTLEKPERAT